MIVYHIIGKKVNLLLIICKIFADIGKHIVFCTYKNSYKSPNYQ